MLGLETMFVMIKPTMRNAIMMVVTAVDTLSTQIFVLIVYVISMKIV